VKALSKKDSGITGNNVLERWANDKHEVRRWLGNLQRKAASAYDLWRFCQWAHKTPSELIALKEANPASKAAERLLDDFVTLNTEYTNSVKVRIATAVKSFYKHNYFDVARASGAIQFEKKKPYNKPSKESLRKLWYCARNPRDRALVTFVNSTALAKETLSNLRWSHIQEDWETADLPGVNVSAELLKGHGKGKYRSVRQITFLTPEAVRDLKVYKEWIERRIGRTLTLEDHVWLKVNEPYEALPYYEFGRLIIQLRKNAGGVKFSWHDARRYVETAIEEVGMNPNWARKIRGRKVRGEEAPYSQPAIEQLRAKFKEAVPILEFTVEQKPSVPKEVQEKLDALAEEQRKIKREYGILTRKHVSKPKPEEIGKQELGQTEEDEETEPCEDGEHCPEFRQVREEELLAYLQDGWTITKELRNGDVIVQRGD
jgi:hypothetical protein